MKKLISCCVLLIAIATMAQDKVGVVKSRFYHSKVAAFAILPGDSLVYNVMQDGQEFDLIILVKEYANTASFDYFIPAKNKSGHITIKSNGLTEATQYDYNFMEEKKTLKDKTTIWLSKKNYKELINKEADGTSINVGSGYKDFFRGENSVIKIKYKGEDKTITFFKAKPDEGKDELWILSDENNPLIIKLNGSLTMELKEVR